MDNRSALIEIYENLNKGYCYFEHIDASEKIRFPYDDDKLFISFFHREFIHWHHFGSSAIKNTVGDLEFIITELFNTSPIEFMEKYQLKKIWF